MRDVDIGKGNVGGIFVPGNVCTACKQGLDDQTVHVTGIL